jgi:hypothetical protein
VVRGALLLAVVIGDDDGSAGMRKLSFALWLADAARAFIGKCTVQHHATIMRLFVCVRCRNFSWLNNFTASFAVYANRRRGLQVFQKQIHLECIVTMGQDPRASQFQVHTAAFLHEP